jgi:hypothetical protein
MPRNPPSFDPELEAVHRSILDLDPDGTRIGRVIRETIDQLLDGLHTGRYRWGELYKTEKTHAGTLVEINLQREFKFKDGSKLDYSIAGADVDCKFSQNLFAWMIPPEAEGHLCLVVWASDEVSKWSAGLVRASKQHLSLGSNRDQKRTLSKEGREAIIWLFRDYPLTPNVFLRLRANQVADILDQDISGQEGVTRLFRHAQKMIVGRAAVATAAQQDDFLKRVRVNGGARDKLQPEGIVILGHEHQQIARDLGLDVVPRKGEFVSVQLVTAPKGSDRKTAEIAGKRWAIARPKDPVQPAPELPRSKGSED